ncbi:MAG: hypothetical protein AMXMBFR7_48700 [Planctomycetota bacterium]
MPFGLWFYAAKVGGGALLAVLLVTSLCESNPAWNLVRTIALSLLIPLGLTGGLLGVLMALGRLRMRCPFCAKSGPAGGSADEGMSMDCPDCGHIRSSGWMKLKLIREFENESPDS